MPRRIDLKGFAYGVLGSFVSRNNDVSGYWGIGKLYSHALRNGVKSVKIDLLSRDISPYDEEFKQIISEYSEMLMKNCAKRNIPLSWVQEVHVYVEFNEELNRRGNPFRCTCEITTDLGRKFAAQVLGRCGPHNPALESKSTRAE
jgi:hypothetical protein